MLANSVIDSLKVVYVAMPRDNIDRWVGNGAKRVHVRGFHFLAALEEIEPLNLRSAPLQPLIKMPVKFDCAK